MHEARELVRYRAQLVQLRSGLKAQVHAVMARERVLPETRDMFDPEGQSLLDIAGYDREVAMLERRIHELMRDDCGHQAIQALDGVGHTLGAIFVTEVGDITWFRSPKCAVPGPG